MQWLAGLLISQILGIWLLVQLWEDSHQRILREISEEFQLPRHPSNKFKVIYNKIRGFLILYLITLGVRCYALFFDTALNSAGIFEIFVAIDFAWLLVSATLTFQLKSKFRKSDSEGVREGKQALFLLLPLSTLAVNLIFIIFKITKHFAG